MFAASFQQHALAQAGAYHQVGLVTGVQAASPHRLVLMLFDGFDEALAQAIGALQEGSVQAKCHSIGRAVRIIDEGLKASLDLAGGGALAADLRDLYAYVSLRLVQANLHNDADGLHECRRLMRPLREAWSSINPDTPST